MGEIFTYIKKREYDELYDVVKVFTKTGDKYYEAFGLTKTEAERRANAVGTYRGEL